MVRSAAQWPTSTQCFTLHPMIHLVFNCKVRSAAACSDQHGAVTNTVQRPSHYIACGFQLQVQGESSAQVSDQHTLHVVFNCKVRVQHGAVTSTLHMWSLTARWECSMVQWPAHFTLHGLELQGESSARCSDQHTLHVVFDYKVRVQHGAMTSTLYITWSLTARWEWSMVQWPAHFTLRGLWLQGESAARCSDQHTLHYVVFDCKVRVQHGAVKSTLYMGSLTARWECSMVQWPVSKLVFYAQSTGAVISGRCAVTSTLYITCGLWLEGESAGQCSDQHTLHGVFDCKVRVQHGAVTSTLYITCSLWLQGEECSVVLWLAILPSEIKSLVASTRCFHTGDVFNRFRIWSTTVPSILFSCFTRISKACNQMFHKDL